MTMPIKLKVLIGLLVVSAIVNLASGLWIPAILGALLAAGVAKGHDGARIAVLVVCVLALVGIALVAKIIPQPLGFFFYVQTLLPPALGLWVMTRDDVKRWFFLRA